jgi:hypothetical protein
MHARIVHLALAAASAAVLAGCGSAGGSADHSQPPPATHAIKGVVVQTTSDNLNGGKAVSGVKVGLYLKQVHAGGPIAADPAQPIRTVLTNAQGGFTFPGLTAGKRYFVFAVGARGYSVGHWTSPGQRVRLVACTDCVMPL